MGINIFISHATLDSSRFNLLEFSKELQKYPNIAKVMIWEENAKIDIIKFMNDNLQECDILLLICTDNSSKSKQVFHEWSACLAANKRIIPVFNDLKNVPFILRSKRGLKCNENLIFHIETIYKLISLDNEINGLCIRCKNGIVYNIDYPFCQTCFHIWAKYKNRGYIENYCHKCGKHYGSTINHPLCDDCFNQEQIKMIERNLMFNSV